MISLFACSVYRWKSKPERQESDSLSEEKKTPANAFEREIPRHTVLCPGGLAAFALT